MGASYRSRGMRMVPVMVFAAGGCLLVGLAGFVNVPSIPPPRNLGERGAPELVVTRVERLPVGSPLREQLQLFDPSPLFMPVPGAGALGGAASIEGRSEGDATGDFPPALQFSPMAPAGDILRPQAPGTPSVAAERLSRARWFEGLARQDDAVAPEAVAVRAARVEVYRLGEAGRVAAMDLARVSGLGSSTWRPLILTVLMDAAGAVTQPVVATSSGVDEVDERIRWIVGRELLPRLALRPGIYRFEVGP